MTTACPHHEWHNARPRAPLTCVDCDVLWPGVPLPTDPPAAALIAPRELPDRAWGTRVRDVQTALLELDGEYDDDAIAMAGTDGGS